MILHCVLVRRTSTCDLQDCTGAMGNKRAKLKRADATVLQDSLILLLLLMFLLLLFLLLLLLLVLLLLILLLGFLPLLVLLLVLLLHLLLLLLLLPSVLLSHQLPQSCHLFKQHLDQFMLTAATAAAA